MPGICDVNDKTTEAKPLTQADIQAAVAAATAPLNAQIANLQQQVTADPAPPPEKEYTRAELDKAVEDGKITPAQAQDILDKQNETKTAKMVKDTVESTITTLNQGQSVDAQIDEYSKLVPEVLVDGSDDRKRVESQFSYFVSIGLPSDKSTELAALNAIYGTVDALRSSKQATQEFETHQETSGGGESRDTIEGTNLQLTKDEHNHYQYLIDRKIYKDWDEVEAEMKYANKQVRARHGRAA